MSEPMITATYENGSMSPDLAEALVALIADMPEAAKDATNPHFGNDYASLRSIWAPVRPILAKHGFALVQLPVPSTEGVCLETRLVHKSGGFLSARIIMPVAQKGNPQAIGSAVTYARRYSMSAMLSIVTEDDDDGNDAAGKGATPARQPSAPSPQTTRAPMAGAAKAPPPAGSQLWHGIVEKVTRREGKSASGPWTMFLIHGRDGERFATFDAKWAEAANFLVGTAARVAWLQGKKGKDLFSIEAMEGENATAQEPPPLDDEDIPF